MKALWALLGRIAYIVSWPGLYFYLRGSERTRILLSSGDLVLVERIWLGDGRWALPGGGLHPGEDKLQGLLRELHEETSLAVPATAVRPLTSRPFHKHGFRFICHYFAASLPEALAPTPQRYEVLEVRWVRREELTSKNAGPDVLTALGLA